MELHGSFLTKEAANTAAENLLQQMIDERGRGWDTEPDSQDGLFQGILRPLHGLGKLLVVDVNCQDGSILHLDEDGNPIRD